MELNTLIVVFLICLLLKLAAELWLDLLNRKSVLAAAGDVPEAYRGFIDEETYNKSVAYTLAKIRVGLIETVYDALILAFIVLSGLLPHLWTFISSAFGSGVWGQSISLFLCVIVIGLPSIPFEWYNQFRLEERFGFNKSTIPLWLTDKIKGLLVGSIIGIPVIATIIFFVELTTYWWLCAFAFLIVFQLIMLVAYPMFIMPLFNKFAPLPEGSLRDKLLTLGDRTGFKAKTILVMDGSKRSTHSNAFFTGFGKFRRIVLFDTLIEQMSEKQLEAVLAHEIGHYKLGHIPKMILVSTISLFISFFLLGWLESAPWFIESFGFETGSLGPVLLMFSILSGLVSFWLTPLTNAFSRKHEYEADNFAKEAIDGDSQPLIDALRKLSEKNLSNLSPHPLYSTFYYSHPTLLEREAHLK